MAHLSGDDRGQILLVAAFALAIIFVAMALIVNSAIFTENLASRGETAGSDGALSMRADVTANVGAGMTAANRHNNSSTSTLRDTVRASVRTISRQTGRQSARSGRVVTVAYQSSRPGERLYQSNGTAFSNETGTTDYTVAEGVSRVDGANGTRAFDIRAHTISATDNASAFEIRAQRSGVGGNQDSWRARIWRDGTDTVHVRTLKNNGTTTVVEDCAVTRDDPSSDFDIDVTDGRIDGEGCDALATAPGGGNFRFGAGTGVTPGTSESYDIDFANADQIAGNFSLVVYNDSTLSLPSLESSTALYDVTVRYTYVTADLRYETDVRVAPGEPDV